MKSRWERFIRYLLISLAVTPTACSEDNDVAAPVMHTAACLDDGANPSVSTTAQHARPEIDLFTLVADPKLTEEQERRLSHVQELEYAMEVHVTRLVEDAFSLVELGQAFGVRVSPAGRVAGVAENVTEHPPLEEGESFVVSWYGPLTEGMGDVSMSIGEDGTAVGGVYVYPTPDRETAMYDIWALGGGLNAMVCLDWTQSEDDDY